MSRSRLRRIAAVLGLIAASPVLLGGEGPRDNFDMRLLAAHNRERDAMGVAPLRWDPALATAARGWALYLASTGKFEHSPDDRSIAPQGENLWAGTVGYYQPEAMVGLWAAEKRDFKPGTFPYNSRSGDVENVGHYTQLIWAKTGAVGCALAKGREEDVLVCRYSRAGNVLGQRPI